MTEPDPAVLEAVAQLARDLPHVDADTAWARLAHLTPEQRAEIEGVVGGAIAEARAPDG
jgi:alkylhydroperoxidase family enzyme